VERIMAKTKTDNKNFEKSLKDLEKIVEQLESGKLELDNSLLEFEKGVNLYKNCKDQLLKAEKKITVLTDSLKEEEFELSEED
jgi:exodeoxyribonuclease VII small subunit